MPGKQVQQSTFDAIVREAMTEFGMTAEEAVADAREQLMKAGVTDQSNLVDPTAHEADSPEHEGLTFANRVREALQQSSDSELVQLLTQFSGPDDAVAAVAGANNGVDAVIDALMVAEEKVRDSNWSLVTPVCSAIVSLCGLNEANRSRFAAAREKDGVEPLKVMLNVAVEARDEDSRRTYATFLLRALGAVQRRSEPIKQRVARGTFLGSLLRLLQDAKNEICGQPEVDGIVEVISETCNVLRQSLTPDDATVTVAETFNRARIVCGGGSATESGLRPLDEEMFLPELLYCIVTAVQDSDIVSEKAKSSLVARCLGLTRVCAVSDEICLSLAELGFDTLAISLMQAKSDELPLVQCCMSLLRNLAARDECKGTLFERMAAVRDVALLHMHSSHNVQEYFCGFVASMCLRRPDIARWAVKHDVVKVVLEAMEVHNQKSSLQRMACLAIRNVSSRDQSAQEALRAMSRPEALVRRAWKAFPRECDEVAYNALRDLDVLEAQELRRDDRYTMPDGFYSRPVSTQASRKS